MNNRADKITMRVSIAVVYFLFALAFLQSCSASPDRPDGEPMQVSDVPLLTEAEKLEAFRTDSVSFEAGGTRYVIEEGARDALADYL